MATTTSTSQEIDDAFRAAYRALNLKEQRKALKSAMRKEGNRVRKAVMENIKSSGLKDSHGNIQNGVYSRVYPDRYGAGFMVSVKPHGNKGIHVNSRGKKKPILMWADGGTDERHIGARSRGSVVKSRDGKSHYRKYQRGGHSTGRMEAKNFITKTEQQEVENVEKSLFENLSANIMKAAKKHGLL